MDSPDTPNLDPPTPPTGNPVDQGAALIQHAIDIADIVKRDRQRRRRTSLVMLIFLIGTLALAGVVFAFGRTDQQITQRQVEKEVGSKAPTIVENEVQAQLSSEPVQNRFSLIVDQQLSSEPVKQKLGSIANSAVAERFDGKFQDLANQIQDIESGETVVAASAPFNKAEIGRIKQAISTDIPKQGKDISYLFQQVDRLSGDLHASNEVSWSRDKADITKQLGVLEDKIKYRDAKIEELTKKIDLVLSQIGAPKNSCLELSEVEARTFRTYSIKENTTSRIYDLNLKIDIDGVKDEIVRGLTVRKITPQGTTTLFKKDDVTMGEVVSFEDDLFRFKLIPIFINRRVLAKDFVGVAISRSRICTP